MQEITMKIRKRQSGKTFRIIGRFLKHASKHDHPVIITINPQTKDHIAKMIGMSYPRDVPISLYQNWKDNITDETKLILLDEFDFGCNVKRIIKFAKKNNIRVIGYSSRKKN